MKVFLAPRSNERSYRNFRSTITSGVAPELVTPFLNDSERAQLSGRRKYYIWGNLESIRGSWEEMEHGDYVLFYRKGFFVYAGQCHFKKFSPELAVKLWPPAPENQNRPWSCLFFVENLTPIKFPIEELNRLAGYKENFIVMGFMPLREKAVQNLIDTYGGIKGFIERFRASTPIENMDVITRIGGKEHISGESLQAVDEVLKQVDEESLIDEIAVRNIGQAPEVVEHIVRKVERDIKLVKMLKKLYGNHCQVCGTRIKTKEGKFYSEVAHLKPVATRLENVDTMQNMLVLCPNHHKLLDVGEVRFDEPKTLYLNGEKFILTMKHKIWTNIGDETVEKHD
ncbi:MAG: HNH endonuclease [Parcubacteria group bacterium]